MRRVFICAWWFFQTIAPAQTTSDSLTLRQLIAEALAHNPRLAVQRSIVSAAAARVDQARAWESPTFMTSWMDVPSTALNPFGDAMARRFEIEQMIPFPGKISAATDAASAATQVSRFRLTAAEQTIIAELKGQLVDLSAIRRRLQLNTEQHALLEQLLGAVQTKYAVGRAQQSDVLRLSIESRKLMNERSSLERERITTEGMLNTLLGRPVDTQWKAIPDLPATRPSASLEELLRLADQRRPELQMAEADISMAQADLTMAHKEYWPDVALGGAYSSRSMIPDSWDLMIGIKIPIAPWSIGGTSGRVEERTALLAAAQHGRTDMQRMISFEVQDQWHRMSTRWDQAEQYRRSILPESRQALDALRAAYQSSSADFLSLIDAFRMLQMLEMEWIMEEMEFQMARVALERAVGMDLE